MGQLCLYVKGFVHNFYLEISLEFFSGHSLRQFYSGKDFEFIYFTCFGKVTPACNGL
jgi:hypothetical protein